MEKENKKVNVIITGCIHGCLKKMYDDILKYSQKNNIKIDLVLCTGDFESLIEKKDLNYLSCPDKYKHMGDFHLFYEGKYPIPFTTIFIGGNHEASNILDSNFYGGYICEKIYYLGRTGSINFKGIKICGISGIYNYFDYFKGHFEKNIANNIKSIFHVREFDIAKLSFIKQKIDIFVSHDWPTNIISKEDLNDILKINSNWNNDILKGKLGSFPNEFLLKMLKPKNWACGHMHFYYKNIIYHNDDSQTNVFCLDKCLNKRKYFELIQIEKSINEIDINDNNIYIDNEWINITQNFNEIFPCENINYDYSNFIRNNGEYLEMKKKFYSHFQKLNEGNFNYFKDEFMDNIKKEKSNLELFKVNYNINQYESMIQIFNIKDSHKSKKSIQKVNTEKNEEEIDLNDI